MCEQNHKTLAEQKQQDRMAMADDRTGAGLDYILHQHHFFPEVVIRRLKCQWS